MNNYILVGNGSSLLRDELGEVIDLFNNVVRFNSFKIKNFEKNVGVKTTHWFTGTSAFGEKNFRIQHNYQKVFVHSWEPSVEKCQNFDKLNAILFCRNIEKLDHSIFKNNEYAKAYNYYTFSTGLIAIFRLLQEENQISIIGYDWWNENQKHHYGDNEIRGNLHNPAIEKLIIDDLVLNNRVNYVS